MRSALASIPRIGLVTALVLVLAGALGASPASAGNGVRIVAPKTVAAPGKARFAVRAGRVVRVAFYIDGKRRWRRRAAGRRFGRGGRLDTARLGGGRHVLLVRAKKRGGRVVRERQILRVAANQPLGNGRGSLAEKPKRGRKPAPAPTEDPEPTLSPEAEPQPEPAPTPGVLFRGDFESGFDDWYVQSLASRATLFSAGAFEGDRAARFEVQDGDVEPDTGSERSEVEGPKFNAGEDLYIRDAIRVPGATTYEGPWQIIQQLHETSWDGSPGIALFLDENRVLQLGAGDGSPTYWRSTALQADRWYDLVYRVKLSGDPSEGFVEVWLDGAPQTLLNGQTRAYGQTIQAARTYIKAGIYRSKHSTGTSLIEHDAIVIGNSLAAVTTAG